LNVDDGDDEEEADDDDKDVKRCLPSGLSSKSHP
jgi:hypothetical protein